MTIKDKSLHCSCCGNQFRGKQYHDHDTGFGTCSKCCDWILSRADWAYDHDRIKSLMVSQWPGMAGNTSWPVPRSRDEVARTR